MGIRVRGEKALHILVFALFLCGGSEAAPTLGPVTFTDVTRQAGFHQIQHKLAELPFCLLGQGLNCGPERMAGGAAAGDVDGDGWTDLVFTRLHAHDIFYRNRGDGTFEDRSESAGLSEYNVQSNGCALGDIDNDGDLDLFITTLGEADDPVNGHYYLFLNDGTGVFTEDAQNRGVDLQTGYMHSGFSATLGDYDLDGWLDLHVTEWGLGQNISHNRLFHNRGDAAPGHFEDVTIDAGVLIDDSPD